MPAGELGMSARRDNLSGDNPYLQKLPPVLRRSVCGTGPRQHAQAVHDGTRKSDGTLVPVGPAIPAVSPPRKNEETDKQALARSNLAKVYAL